LVLATSFSREPMSRIGSKRYGSDDQVKAAGRMLTGPVVSVSSAFWESEGTSEAL
jgi:hypothetical protein